MKLIYERSQPGRRASSIPHPDVPRAELPAEYARARAPRLAELAEPELVRHFTELSTRTFGIDTGFYPLGSCTMKHNPRVSERLVNLPGFRDLHPHQSDDGAQGALELMWRLERMLADVVGLDAVSLQPAAGSQGELTGLTIMRAYFIERGRGRHPPRGRDPRHRARHQPRQRRHGGLHAGARQDRRPRQHRYRRSADGGGPHDRRIDDHQPHTLGLFEENITEIAEHRPRPGALVYLDGANMNAIVRHHPARRLGLRHDALQPAQDVRRPHGGGGPGGGPVAVREHLAPYPADAP